MNTSNLDVVAVLRAMPQTHEERRAINAVAELIAAADRLQGMLPSLPLSLDTYHAREELKALRAALTACKPANAEGGAA